MSVHHCLIVLLYRYILDHRSRLGVHRSGGLWDTSRTHGLIVHVDLIQVLRVSHRLLLLLLLLSEVDIIKHRCAFTSLVLRLIPHGLCRYDT